MANKSSAGISDLSNRCQLKPDGKECVGGPQGHADCCIPYEPWDADAFYRFVTKADFRRSVLAAICRELNFDYDEGPEEAVKTIRATMAKIGEQKAELLDSAATIRQLTRTNTRLQEINTELNLELDLAKRVADKSDKELEEARASLRESEERCIALRSACIEVANERNGLQKKLDLAEARLVMAARTEENLRTVNAEQVRRIESQRPPTVNDPEAVVGTVQFERAGRALGKSTALGDDALGCDMEPDTMFSQPGYAVGARCNRNGCHGILTLSYGLRKCPVCGWMH